jgi:hypothetical protein
MNVERPKWADVAVKENLLNEKQDEKLQEKRRNGKQRVDLFSSWGQYRLHIV